MFPGMETFGLAGRRVIRFGVVYAFVVVVTSALGLAGYSAIRSGAADPTAFGTQASVLIGAAVTGLVALVCILGLAISAVVWIVSAHRLRAAGPGFPGYASAALGLILTVLAYVVPAGVPSVNGAVLTEAALRIGAVAVLIAGVVVVRGQVQRATGQQIPGRRPRMATSEDWDASKWDPEVMRDIERRRGSEEF
jgi:hypothetical protein